MAKVSVYNMEGNEVGTMELSDAVFGVEIKENLVHQAVRLQLADNRQGTQKAKTRAEVSGGGRKPWRQKGTGHARQGSIRAPQWKGGGIVFAPTPRDYSFKMNRKERQAALKSVLTSKVQENNFLVLEDLKFDVPKTKDMKKVLDALHVENALLIVGKDSDNVVLSARNLPDVASVAPETINVFDLLNHNTIIATKSSVASIEEVYA